MLKEEIILATRVWQVAYVSGWDKGYDSGFNECTQLKELGINQIEKNYIEG